MDLIKLQPPKEFVESYQQGNVEPMLDWYCNDAGISWGEEGARTQCMEIAEGHVDDPAAFCQFLNERCGGATSSESAELQAEGGQFRIWAVEEGRQTDDGRFIREGAIRFREQPIPVMWLTKTTTEHQEAERVGTSLQVTRDENWILVDARPVDSEVAQMFTGAVGKEDAGWPSIDLIDAAAEVIEDEDGIREEIVDGVLAGVTMVPTPAQEGTKIELMASEAVKPQIQAGVSAASAPLAPPAEWFENPGLMEPTPLTVMDDGRVFGHIATWDQCHTGRLGTCITPPRSKSSYAYFRTGIVVTPEAEVPVGQITLVGGHAGIKLDAKQAAAHYDDTRSAVCDVACGEDAYGLWVAGALRPGVTDEQIRTLRASSVSGDWRPIRGSLELVAIAAVNVPGYPITRALVASSGEVLALVGGAVRRSEDEVHPSDVKFLRQLRMRELERAVE